MRILHTSDWHLGRRLLGKDLTIFQSSVIDEIATIADTKNVDIVVVAGGIFDGDAPTAEAIGLFLKAVEKLTDGGKRAMVVTAGDDDSRAVMNSFSHLSRRYNLAIFPTSSAVIDYDGENEYETSPIESGRGYIIYRTAKGETAVVAALCRDGQIGAEGENSADVLKRTVDSVTRKFSSETFNIVVGNLRMKMQSELMADDGMPTADMFPYETNYIALGGMPRSEICDMDRSAYYSGGILPLDPDDNKGEKGVIIANISEDFEVRKEISRFKTSKKFKRIKCTGIDDADTQLYKYDDCLVEMSLMVTSPLSAAENDKLFRDHPNLLQINLSVSQLRGERKKKNVKAGQSDAELLKSFLGESAPGAYDAELAELFTEIMEEVK